MPQQFKKRGRGRRGEEKEKRENLLDQLQKRNEENAERPTKRRRISWPEEVDHVVLDQPDDPAEDHGQDSYHAYEVVDASEEHASYEQQPELQFFGHLDDSEQAFLKRIDLILANNAYESPEEKPLFLGNAWNEVKGKEMKVACSQSCSRVMERLLKASGKDQLKGAWSRMQGNFLALVQHRFASHVVEALLTSCAPYVSEELLAEDQKEEEEEGRTDHYDDDETLALKKSMEQYYIDTVAELQDNLGYLMTDQFASHSLRVVLLALSGRPLAGSGAVSLLQSKKKEKIVPKDELSDSTYQKRVVPDSFGQAINHLITGTLAGLDTHYIRALATNPLANPVLQLFLELEFATAGKQKAKDDKSLYRRLMPDDPPSEGTQSAAFIKGLLFDPVGSRLLETIVQCAPGKTFKVVYKNLFKDNLSSIVKNEVAGFVVIKILERLSQEELQSSLDQLLAQISMLLERSRHSIIKCLIERCRVRGVSTKQLAEVIKDALGGSGKEMFSRLLQPSVVDEQDVDIDRKAQTEKSNVKMHASILAQSMLSQQDALQKLILEGLLSCDADFLALIAKDRQATHVLQNSLNPEVTDKNFRRPIVQKLTTVLMDLALDRVGSHVVDTLIGATSGLQFLRERIAEEILRNESQIRESETRAIWKNWMMNLYQWRRTDWIARMKEQTDGSPPIETNARPPPQTRDKFSKQRVAEPNHKTKQKSGIEAARARFAAQEGKNRRVGGPRHKFGTVAS